MKAILVCEVVETDYSGTFSVRRTEHVEVEIIWPERVVPWPKSTIVGDWRLSMPVLQFAEGVSS